MGKFFLPVPETPFFALFFTYAKRKTSKNDIFLGHFRLIFVVFLVLLRVSAQYYVANFFEVFSAQHYVNAARKGVLGTVKKTPSVA